MANFIEDLILTNSKMIHKNFEGRASKFNRPGDKNFSVVIASENVDCLREAGWRVREMPPRPDVEGSEPLYFIDVRVNFDSARPPEVYLCTSKKKTRLDAESVGTLDHAEIKNVDMVVHPHLWSTSDGKSGVKAYLKTLYVTIEEDPFAERYGDLEMDNDPAFENPFN